MRPKIQPLRVLVSVVTAVLLLTAIFIPSINRAAELVLLGINILPADPTIGVNQTQQFSAVAVYDNGSQQPIGAGSAIWAGTGSLATPRYYHTATRLPDGSVLVTGGFNNLSSLASAERYNPVTGSWTPAGNMAAARSAHTATLLPNGKVLVIGGINFANNAVTSSTDLYDPISNTWSPGPNLLNGVRAFHSAVLLGNGTVLVTAGVRGWPDCTYRRESEIYNPATNSFQNTGLLALARSNASTTLLANGNVLLAGGPANNCPTPNHGLNEAEVYNPLTGAWTVTGSLSIPRYLNFITPLPNGTVMLAGGTSQFAASTASTDIYHLATGTFSAGPPMAAARSTSGGTGDNGRAVTLADGRVMIPGGHNHATGAVTSGVELFNPTTGTWSPTSSLTTPRTHNTTTLLSNGVVLVVGGHGGGGPLASAELYLPEFTWSSSNTNVATVDQSGKATAVGVGTTTISLSGGGVSGNTTLTVATDTVPPATTAGYAAPNANGWHKTDVMVQLNATDSGGPVPASGVQSITYSLSGAQNGVATVNGPAASFTIFNEGTTTVTYHAVDNNGNIEPPTSFMVRIDKTAPTLAGLSNISVNATSVQGAIVQFSPIAADALSGIDLVAVTQGLASGSTFPHGVTNQAVTAFDKAGNSASQGFTVTVNKTLTAIAVAPPSATLSSSQNTQQFTAVGSYTDGSSQPLLNNGGNWMLSGSLATPRSYHTATRLPDGSVLVVGGYTNVTTFASAERYYPSTHTWASAGSMAIPRLGHSATLLPNGKVIVVGGRQYPQNTQTNTTEIYDPVTNTWSAGPSLTLGVREAHSAILLNNGKLLVAAGLRSYPDCTYHASAELYNPATNSWSATGSLNLARSSATTVLLPNGKVLMAGGPQNNCPTPNVGMSQAELYDPATGTWTVTGTMSATRYANTITVLPNGKVLLAGGVGAGGTVASADIYDPQTGTFSPAASLGTARITAIGTGDNGAMPLLSNGKVIVPGGHNPFAGTVFSSTELFDPISGTWQPTGALNTARTNHTTTLLDDGSVLVVGGVTVNGAALASAERYTPPALSWSSSNNSVATVNQGGVATAGADGSATITASAGTISGDAVLTVDRTAPTTIANTPPANGAGWHKTDVQVTLNAADGGGTGVQSITYSFNGAQNGGPFTALGSSVNLLVSAEGTTTLSYRATDEAGNAGNFQIVNIKVDKSAPFLSYPNQVQAVASSNAGAVVNFFVSANDNISGIAGPVTVSPLQSGATFPIGTTTQTVTATDNAGNTSTATFDVVVAPGDQTPPTTTANYPGPNAQGWNRFNVFVSLNAFDSSESGSPSGVKSISYSLSGAQTGNFTAFNTNNTSFTIFNEGTTTVTYFSTDNRDNVEAPKSFTVKLDKTPPTAANLGSIQVNATSTAGAVVNFNLAAADALSGVDTVMFTQGLPSGSTFPHGTTNESVTITDKAGNTAFRSFSITVNKALLSIAVQPSTAEILVGDNIGFQAMGHFTSGPDQILPTGGGGGGGGQQLSGSFWSLQMPLSDALNVSACGPNVGPYTSQPISATSGGSPARFGPVNMTWGNPAVVQIAGTIDPQEIHLTLTCVPNNGATGSIDATWTGTRFEGTWSFSGSSGNAAVLGWSSKAPLPEPRFSLGAAAVNGIVYAIGGNNPSLPSPVEAYNPATDSWSTVSQLPISTEGPGVAALNGIIYVAGGRVAGGTASGVLQAYNPATNTWLPNLASMLSPRAKLALVATGGKLYAIGGETGAGGPATAVVEQYDPIGNAWVPRASMQTARSYHVAGALNGGSIIVAAGGNGSGGSVELYDVAANIWAPGPTMVNSGGAPAAVVVNNGLYVFGINGNLVHLFRPTGPQPSGWAGLSPMPTSRGQLAVAAIGDVVYAIGGQLTGGSTSTAVVEAYSAPLPQNFFVTSGGGGGGGGGSLPIVQWSSSDSSIASINSSGFATGQAAGQTTITATAGGISCTATNGCATLTVNEPTHITFTLAPGSAPFDFVTVTLVDRASSAVLDTFDVPIGEPQEVDVEEADQVRLVFTPPAGYSVSPPEVEPNLHNGDLVIALLFTDIEPPSITAPPAITTEATSPDGAVVDPGQAVGSDSAGPVTITRVPAGNQSPLGTTVVVWRATDAAGNFSEASQAVTVVDTTPPVLTLPGSITVDATNPSGATVNYTASASDIVDGSVAVTCVPPSGSTFAIGTTTVPCSATDAAGNTAAGSFTVLVQAAAAQVSQLIVTVQTFNLQQGIANSLDAKLTNILNALNGAVTGNTTAVCNQLGAFINETIAQSGKKLTVAQADQLIAAAQQIQAVIGCQ